MNIKLERPLICFDLETTGLSVSKDRIISISIIKIFPDGSTESKSKFVNPEMPIPIEASNIHGITDDAVKESPTFKNICKGLFEFIKGCDLLSYNGDNYDIPLLAEEFARFGIEFPERDVNSVDSCTVFKKKHPRNLTEALKFYCDEDLEGAHNSDNDTLATYKVFQAQMLKYDDFEGKSIKEMSDFCKTENRADLAGKLIIDDDGDYVYNIGKNRGQKVKKDPSFCQWMLNQDFPMTTKTTIVRILKEIQDAK